MQRYILFPNKPCVYDDICLYLFILHWVQLSHTEHLIIGKKWKIWSSCDLKHGSQLLKCIPKIQHNSFPSVEAGPSDSLLTNKMQPKWSDNTLEISLCYDCLSACLLSLTRPHALMKQAKVLGCPMACSSWQLTEMPSHQHHQRNWIMSTATGISLKAHLPHWALGILLQQADTLVGGLWQAES